MTICRFTVNCSTQSSIFKNNQEVHKLELLTTYFDRKSKGRVQNIYKVDKLSQKFQRSIPKYETVITVPKVGYQFPKKSDTSVIDLIVNWLKGKVRIRTRIFGTSGRSIGL